MTAALEAQALTRILPGPQPTTLVADVDAMFEPASFTVVTGPSGSGKSSLLYLLGLLDPPTAGDVLVNGESTRALGGEQRALKRLAGFGFVFQFHFLLPELTVLDNVMLPMRQLGRLGHAAMRARVYDLLDPLGMAAAARKVPSSSPGASGNAPPSPAPSPMIRSSFSPTSRPARSIRRMARRCLHLPRPRRRGSDGDRGDPRRQPRADR